MPVSDDEYSVICDVDVLVTKIKRAEIYFDTEMDAQLRKRILANESLEVRIAKWQSRRTILQKLLNDGSSGLSGGPPAASVVATSCSPSLQTGPRKPTAATSSHGHRPTLSYKKTK